MALTQTLFLYLESCIRDSSGSVASWVQCPIKQKQPPTVSPYSLELVSYFCKLLKSGPPLWKFPEISAPLKSNPGFCVRPERKPVLSRVLNQILKEARAIHLMSYLTSFNHVHQSRAVSSITATMHVSIFKALDLFFNFLISSLLPEVIWIIC